MKTSLKVALIISGALFVAGGVFLAAGKALGGKFHWGIVVDGGSATEYSGEYVEEELALEEFDAIVLHNSTLDVCIKSGEEYKVSYCTLEDNIPTVEVKDHTLYVTQKEKVRVGVFLHDVKEEECITITVPDDSMEYDVDLILTSGELSVSDVCVNGKIALTSGEAELSNVKSSKLSCTMTSGNLKGTKLSVEDMYIEMTSGNANLQLEGTPLDYNWKVDKTSGNVEINGENMTRDYTADNQAERNFEATLTSGNLNVSFE